ncbi:MAG: hypothetical protein CMM12_07290 [Rhodospirillaceae bacterium]|nr:hypothetical protein [Rhodospirillaceae bacterium]
MIARRIDGSASTTLTDAIQYCDIPGTMAVMIDDNLLVSGRSEQTSPPQERATVDLHMDAGSAYEAD